jgi:L-aminopeptidase/D-esterase-like protein
MAAMTNMRADAETDGETAGAAGGVAGNPFSIAVGKDATLPEGFALGHAQYDSTATGCTVILCERGATGGVTVGGAAPATRETDLLNPKNSVERVNAVVLSGGSAFGLDASGGVMRYLAERKAGFAVGEAVVPIVCGASLFDLGVGDGSAHPDDALGYAACKAAGSSVVTGSVGAGTGASVGKLLGDRFAMRSGFGAASLRLGELVVTALVAVNALGNVFDRSTGTVLAGTRNPQDPSAILDPYQCLLMMAGMGRDSAGGAETGEGGAGASGANTTLGCVLTNATLTKAQATHCADMAHDGLARSIEPVHTGFDGDAVFVLATGAVTCLPDVTGALGALVMEQAIHDAVRSARGGFGLPSTHDLIV